MDILKKYLYLLQLEDYYTERYFDWLNKHSIDELKEIHGQLKWTLRIILTYLIALFLGLFLSEAKAVGESNNLVFKAFGLIGKIYVLLAKLKLGNDSKLIKIVITGSYGKTTFKEMLAWVLESKYSVIKTEGNINTLVGIASLILKSLDKKHQVFIYEAGAYRQGEIKAICKLVQPAFGVITVFGWMHLERFGTLENIRKAKLEIAQFIKDKQKLFIPQKNHQFIDFEKTVSKIAATLGISQKEIKQKLADFKPPQRRLAVKQVNKYLTVIDDSYNSNPIGFKRAVDLLNEYKNRQKIVVTFGMVEMGKMQFKLNKQAGEQAGKIADILAIVGESNKKALTSGAKQAKNKKLKIVYLRKDEDVDTALTSLLRPPAVVLLENSVVADNYI